MKLSTIPVEIPPEDPICIQINNSANEYVEFLHTAAVKLNQVYDFFWSGDPADVVARFNALGFSQVIAAGTKHNAQAVGLNPLIESALEDKPELAARLIVRAIDVPKYPIITDPEQEGPAILFDGEEFSWVPAPELEPIE